MICLSSIGIFPSPYLKLKFVVSVSRRLIHPPPELLAVASRASFSHPRLPVQNTKGSCRRQNGIKTWWCCNWLCQWDGPKKPWHLYEESTKIKGNLRSNWSNGWHSAPKLSKKIPRSVPTQRFFRLLSTYQKPSTPVPLTRRKLLNLGGCHWSVKSTCSTKKWKATLQYKLFNPQNDYLQY